MLRKRFFMILLGVLACAAVISAWRGVYNAAVRNGTQDLQWQPVRTILAGDNPYEPFLQFVENPIGKPPPIFLSQIPNYPASGYAFLLPIGLFDTWSDAKWTWAIANLLFTVAIVAGLQKLSPLRWPHLIVITSLFAISAPWRTTLGNGQHGLFVLAFFVWAVVFAEGERPILSGICLAASLFKYTLTVPLAIYFIWRSQWRALLVTILTHVLLTQAVAMWIDTPFIELLRQPLQVSFNNDATASGDYDLFAWARMFDLPTIIPALIALIILILLTLYPYLRQVKLGEKRLSRMLQNVSTAVHASSNTIMYTLSILACFAYILFLHQGYDLIVLIMPLWLVAARQIDAGIPRNRWVRASQWSLILLLGMTWFGRRAFLLIMPYFPEPRTAYMLLTQGVVLPLHLIALVLLLITARSRFRENATP